MIKKEGNKYILYSHDGSKKLGEFDSKKDAERREKVINYFKWKDSQKESNDHQK